MHKDLLGKLGEDIVCKFLVEKGYRILKRNFRYKRFGEVDIIALDKGILVFVEVKTRSGIRFGSPEEAVTGLKVRNIRRVATYFILANHLVCSCRIDVISVVQQNNGFKIRHIIDIDNS